MNRLQDADDKSAKSRVSSKNKTDFMALFLVQRLAVVAFRWETRFCIAELLPQ